MSMTLFIAIGMLLAIIPMALNDFTDARHAEIVAELEQRKAVNESET